MTVWTFIPQFFAYGGIWTPADPGGSGSYFPVYIDDEDEPVGVITDNYDGDFWGFISDAPFTSVTLVGGAGDNQQSCKLKKVRGLSAPGIPPTLIPGRPVKNKALKYHTVSFDIFNFNYKASIASEPTRIRTLRYIL